MDDVAEPSASYGGAWPQEKLNILKAYLDAYTTALKDQSFKLVYIDAFAGTGSVELASRADPDALKFIQGSAAIAVGINNKPFDKLIFVEKDQDRYSELTKLIDRYPDRDIQIENSDANKFLRELQLDWRRWRGVLFLDPFGTQVEWATIEMVAGFNALDIWILFSVSAISRMLPQSKRPEDVTARWVARLNKVFGDESWRALYSEIPQEDLFRDTEYEREPGIDGILNTYKGKLAKLFGKRFLEKSRLLKNSKNAALFDFLFCVGNVKGNYACETYCRAYPEEDVAMSTYSTIEWTETTWNPVTGCAKISHGCKHCYAERMSQRLRAMGVEKYRHGFTTTVHESALSAPLHWRKPRVVFVNSMSGLFHQSVPSPFIEAVFQTMNRASHHTFQVLTKRPSQVARMAARLHWTPNIWLGASIESERWRGRLIPLKDTPAHTKFLSLEPLLGPLPALPLDGIDWVIVGGESGPGARPMQVDWVRDIRDQSVRHHVPFFFKQWGGPVKKRTGRSLDGQTWDQMPARIRASL